MAKKPAKAKKSSKKKRAVRSTADTLQACVCDALKLSQSDLLLPFAKLWPYEMTRPVDHIDDACRRHKPRCYTLTRADVRTKWEEFEKTKKIKINTVADFIKCIGS